MTKHLLLWFFYFLKLFFNKDPSNLEKNVFAFIVVVRDYLKEWRVEQMGLRSWYFNGDNRGEEGFFPFTSNPLKCFWNSVAFENHIASNTVI